jgi:hypothetical protein
MKVTESSVSAALAGTAAGATGTALARRMLGPLRWLAPLVSLVPVRSPLENGGQWLSLPRNGGEGYRPDHYPMVEPRSLTQPITQSTPEPINTVQQRGASRGQHAG